MGFDPHHSMAVIYNKIYLGEETHHADMYKYVGGSGAEEGSPITWRSIY